MARAADLERGQVWLASWDPDIGRHPALLVSRTAIMRRRWRATIATVTSTIHGLPSEVAIGPAEGLAADSVIDCEDLYTVSIEALTEYLGRLDEQKLQAVDIALRVVLALE
jgi:mRNA interferase MazF